jgi:hypothetical protein
MTPGTYLVVGMFLEQSFQMVADLLKFALTITRTLHQIFVVTGYKTGWRMSKKRFSYIDLFHNHQHHLLLTMYPNKCALRNTIGSYWILNSD